MNIGTIFNNHPFPPTGSVVSTNTVVKPIDMPNLYIRSSGLNVVPNKGHSYLFEINDWDKFRDSKVPFYTPTINFDNREFVVEIFPHGQNQTKLKDDKIGIFLKYNSKGRDDWSVCLKYKFMVIVGDFQKNINMTNSPYIAKDGFGYSAAVFPSSIIHATTCKSIKVILQMELLDVWNNEKPINCDNPDCKKVIIKPVILQCGHTFCAPSCNINLFKCPICTTCICTECSKIKKA